MESGLTKPDSIDARSVKSNPPLPEDVSVLIDDVAELYPLDETIFVVDDETFEAFTALLDTPSSPSPVLISMLNRRAPWG